MRSESGSRGRGQVGGSASAPASSERNIVGGDFEGREGGGGGDDDIDDSIDSKERDSGERIGVRVGLCFRRAGVTLGFGAWARM